MKKRLWIVLVIIVLCLIALVVFLISRPKLYRPEIIEPEVFEDAAYDTDLLIGLWQSETVYYRYNEDGTGSTWDTADDVTEEEAGRFTWEINKKRMIHKHQLEIGGTVPKAYTIKRLDLLNLEYTDDYGKIESFVKIE